MGQEKVLHETILLGRLGLKRHIDGVKKKKIGDDKNLTMMVYMNAISPR